MRLILGALLLLGCGGANFEGVWSGVMTNQIACDGADRVTNAGPVRAVVAQRGDYVTLNFEGECGLFEADAVGTQAAVRSKKCPNVTYTGGTFRLVAPDRLDVMLLSKANVGSCSASQSGVLGLEK